MKIAILGTRGIPNNYGGFEQFAEYLSVGLSERGHDVYVYTSHDHSYQSKEWKGVKLLHIKNPEASTGTWGQFLYDLYCIRDSRKRNFDIIYQLGYTSSSLWGWLLPRGATIVTNMDGLEWKRTKYSKVVQRFLLFAEKLAIKTSDFLVADSLGIKNYISAKYKAHSTYLPYGTYLFGTPDETQLKRYSLLPFNYNMLIARLEPENNIEVILEGVKNSTSNDGFLVIGNYNNKFGLYLKNKFSGEDRIRFLGSEYDIDLLNNLRHFTRLYFHGHSVGGTNPSLLEAMGSNALICAHDNEFNKSILGSHAFYFSDSKNVADLLDRPINAETRSLFVEENKNKVRDFYLWPKIISDYERFFTEILR